MRAGNPANPERQLQVHQFPAQYRPTFRFHVKDVEFINAPPLCRTGADFFCLLIATKGDSVRAALSRFLLPASCFLSVTCSIQRLARWWWWAPSGATKARESS